MEIKRDPVVIAGKAQGYAKGTRAIGARGIVFLSGSVGLDETTGTTPAGPKEQAKIALGNIKKRLEEYGTSLANILHIWIYVNGNFPQGVARDPRYPEIGATMQDFWKENCPEFQRGGNPPAMTLLGVTGLGLPEWHMEIQVVAAVP